MGRYRDDGEVQIDNSTNGRFRNVFQWLSVITALNVGTLLVRSIMSTGLIRFGVLPPKHGLSEQGHRRRRHAIPSCLGEEVLKAVTIIHPETP
jgi:hypothetical protein